MEYAKAKKAAFKALTQFFDHVYVITIQKTDDRRAKLLPLLEGLSYEEIAQLTASSVPAVKSRLHRARLSLRAAIDRFYADAA